MHAYIHITQAQFGIPLAALHCAPQDCEQVLLQWASAYKSHMVITDSLRSPWALAGEEAPGTLVRRGVGVMRGGHVGGRMSKLRQGGRGGRICVIYFAASTCGQGHTHANTCARIPPAHGARPDACVMCPDASQFLAPSSILATRTHLHCRMIFLSRARAVSLARARALARARSLSAAGQSAWPCPVHGVDSEHVFPPNLHAAAIAQGSLAEFFRARRAASHAQLAPFRHPSSAIWRPLATAGQKSGGDVSMHGAADCAAQAETVAGLRAMEMELQLPLFKCRANLLRPHVLGGAVEAQEHREWVLDWPLYVPPLSECGDSATADGGFEGAEGRGEGGEMGEGQDARGWISALPKAVDWDEAEKVVAAHGAWQAGLGEPPKNIALTASFSSAGSLNAGPSPAMPLCTHMSEAHGFVEGCFSPLGFETDLHVLSLHLLELKLEHVVHGIEGEETHDEQARRDHHAEGV